MKTILVPTDFSDHANYALKVAANLAKKYGSKIIMLHMLEIPEHLMSKLGGTNDVVNVTGSHSGDIPAAIFYMKLAHKRFGEVKKQEFLKGVNYEEAVQNHLTFKGIIESAHKYKADLIVMGSHGATGFKEVFVGSNTEKVVRTSDVPVLVIKEDLKEFKVDNFVFASSLDRDNDEVLIKAFEFSKKLGAKFHLVFVNTPFSTFLTTSQIEDKLQALLALKNLDHEQITSHVYNDKSVEQGILNFSKKIGADLIAVPTHGLKGLSHFLNGSISEDVVNHAKTPVITFKIA